MSDPILDFRTTEQFYQQALALARAYANDWTSVWVTQEPGAKEVNEDPGLVMLKLFALLARYIGEMENQIPNQRQLAFYQFLDLQLRPPLAAQAPLSFTLQAGQPPFEVPLDSGVADADTQEIRFQTNQSLLVVPATLSALLTIIPSQDRYTNAFDALRTGQSAPLFLAQEDDTAEIPLSHWFMLGDPSLFKPDPTLQRISVNMTGVRLAPEYFTQWADGALNPLNAVITEAESGLQLSVLITQPPTSGPLSVAQLEQELYAADGRESGFATDENASAQPPEYWLLVQPAPLLRITNAMANVLPVITGLTCTLSGDSIQPEQAASGPVQVNVRNGVYPFGQTPAVEDAFYMRSDSLFARQGAAINLDFVLSDVSVDYPVTLYWQFWDGSAWQSFNATPAEVSKYRFVDTTNALRNNNPLGPTRVSFLCPDIRPTTVAGAEGRWIRVVIASGGYGDIGGITTEGVSAAIGAIPESILTQAQKDQVTAYLNDVEGVNFSYTYTPSSYAPPYIQSLQLSYSYTATPASLWTYNAFALSRFRFNPFKPVEDRYTCCNLGFAPDDFSRYTLGHTLTLYFYLSQEYGVPAPSLGWEYYNGSAWLALSVDDGTAGLTRSGIVSFTVPDDMRAATLYSQQACWLRIQNPHPRQNVAVYGVYPNTVMAGNRSIVLDETLGSSNEQPGQTFQLSYTPVLSGLALDVIEPAGMEPVESADGRDLAFTVTPSSTSPQSGETVTRRWMQVDTFSFSGPTARAYIFDSENGLITFGDGHNGMIPPRGYNNIIATRYEYTQGLAGNVMANQLSVLRPGYSAIAAVSNPAPAQGGVNGDSVDELEIAAPPQVKANDRAVQLDDLDTLGRAASPAVCRAHAVLAPDQRIAVGVLALSEAPRPYAPPALLDEVTVYLRARCLAPLAPRIYCCEPDYVPIDVVAQVTVKLPSDQRNAVQQDLAKQLQAFFQPVFGGPMGQGWAFGQTVQAAQVSRFLRKDPRVIGVAGLALNGQQGGDVALKPNQVPVCGSVSVLAYTMARER